MRGSRRRRRASTALALCVGTGVTIAACGDDSYTATNEVEIDASEEAGDAPYDGSTSGSCEPGATLELGSCERCGNARRLCGENGEFGDVVCEEQGACEAGQSESEPCGNCGTQTRVCSDGCVWGEWGACGATGECAPGAVAADCKNSVYVDPCLERICGNDCKWGACKLKPGAVCAWQDGKNYKCCGADKWQYCSKVSCDYFPCETCNCSAC